MRQAYWALRLIVLVIVGVIATLATGNPLYLAVAAVAFLALAFYTWRLGYVYEPKWEPLASQGEVQGSKGDWPAAAASFAAAMKKCRNPRERRQASEQIGTYLLRNDRIGEAEPYLRQAVNLTTAVLGPAHAKTTALRDQLSDLYLKSGQAGLAAKLQGRAVAAAPSVNAQARYAEILQQSGDPAAAATQYQKALQQIEATKDDSPTLIPPLLSAARYASGAGDHKRAEELLRRASRCMYQGTPKKTIDEILSTLVDVLVAEEHYADAVTAMQERLTRMAPEPAEGAAMRRDLADLMDKAGMTDDAARQRRLAQTLEGMASAAAKPS